MKKLFKKLTAVSLVVAMLVAPTGVFAQTDATAASTKTVTGNNTAVNPIYKVSLPTTLVFAIDAFNLNGNGEVSSNNYAIINRSNVPVQVKTNFKTKAKTGTTLADATISNAADTKEAFLQLSYATAKGANAEITEKLTTLDWTYGAGVQPLTAAADQTDGVSLVFLLDKAAYTDGKIEAGDIEATSMSGFKIIGDVTTYPKTPWAASDVTVTAVFTIAGVTTGDYTSYVTGSATDKVANSMNIYTELTPDA